MNYFPPLKTEITTQQALYLTDQYHLSYLSDRVRSSPEKYHSWQFDGVSGLPDRLFRLIGDQWMITYYCAMPHDLAYAYGRLGDRLERKTVDRLFYRHLIDYGQVHPVIARLCYLTVRLLGSEKWGTSFTWGFANREREGWSDRPLIWTY